MSKTEHSALIARTPETLPFWKAAAENRLVLPFCEDCGRHHWYPRAICPHCHGQNLRWKQSAGHGTIHSIAVMHRASPPEATAIVQLDEGICIYTQIRLGEDETAAIGDRVLASFEPVSSASSALVFRLPTGA